MSHEKSKPGLPAPAKPQLIITPMRKVPPDRRMLDAFRQFREIGLDFPRMQESHFIDFLKEFVDPVTLRWNIPFWSSVFGDMRRGVAVTHDHDPSKIKYICPPPAGSIQTTIPSWEDNHTLFMIGEMVEQVGRQKPIESQRVLEKGLEGYARSGRAKPLSTKEAFLQILRHYGIVGQDPSVVATENKTKAVEVDKNYYLNAPEKEL